MNIRTFETDWQEPLKRWVASADIVAKAGYAQAFICGLGPNEKAALDDLWNNFEILRSVVNAMDKPVDNSAPPVQGKAAN